MSAGPLWSYNHVYSTKAHREAGRDAFAAAGRSDSHRRRYARRERFRPIGFDGLAHHRSWNGWHAVAQLRRILGSRRCHCDLKCVALRNRSSF